MKVIGYDPYLSIEHAWNLSHHVKRVNDLAEIFEKADYITVHTPATDETTKMLNWKNLSKCKKGVILLNYARDEITDKEAVLKAIDEGIVRFFGTDFGSEKFYHHPQVFNSSFRWFNGGSEFKLHKNGSGFCSNLFENWRNY